jgi:adenosylhomocysteine nucleosidase/adenosylhomocysteine/aminodeoxyfutalosine nucleosidase
MIGISIATKWEYEASLEYFGIKGNDVVGYLFGVYFFITIDDT